MASRQKRALKLIISVFLVGALAVLFYEISHWLTHVYESGARVQTELTKVSSRVDGTIDRILVTEGDRVTAGQPLIVLVDDDIELNIETLKADLTLEEARRARLVSEKNAFEAELQSRIETKRKQIGASEVEYGAIQDRLRLAERDLARVKVLFGKELTSEKDLATEQDKVLILQGEASHSTAKIEIAKRQLDQVAATRKQLDVIEDRIKISDITSAKIDTMIERERVSLSFRHIRSPIDGVIDHVYKHKGEYVEEGERILILHDEDVFWIEANVDEDQIRHVRVGQEVLIHFEAYPFDEYLGAVLQIGSATTMEMGISTASSAGQFGRPAQRVPVRVSIQNPPSNLVPGMLATINVRISDEMKLRSVFHLLKSAGR